MIAALVSCTQEPELTTKDSSKVQASAADFQCDESFTRTTITQSGSAAPTFAWKAGDVIGVIPTDGKTVQSNYEISKIDSDPKTATFDGGVWALKEGKEYAAYYPYSEVVARKDSKLEFSFRGQTQTANNSLEHISSYDYMYAQAVTASSGSTAFNFKHLVSLVRMQITVPKTDEYTTLTLESDAAWFAGKAELSLADGNMASTQSLKVCTIALDDIAVNSGEVLTVWFSMLPTTALDGKSITVKLYGKNSFSTIELTGLKTFEAGKAYSFSCAAGSSSTEMKYVDLGLSVKWATCNLGASAPEEYGDYYAWGDIETYYEDGYAQEWQEHWKSGKTGGYSLENYKYYQIDTVTTWVDAVVDADGFEITPGGEKTTIYKGYSKYVRQEDSTAFGFKGFYDNLAMLQASDDVAHIKLGGKWRMPTDAEFTELRENCTWTWGAYKGINGYKVTSNKAGYTDKWIFLPAAGYRHYSSLYGVGSDSSYWSSSLNTYNPYYAYYLYFDSGYVCKRGDVYRFDGQSVRPVSE